MIGIYGSFGGAILKPFIGAILGLFCGMAFAADPVSVTHAWVAATAPGQQVGGAYMDISSQEDVRLVRAESPVAGKVMIHSMTMKNGIMEMRKVDALDIPAGKTVSLAPGKMHLMLMDMKKRLVPGERVPLRLTFVQDGKETGVDVDAAVTGMSRHMEMP